MDGTASGAFEAAAEAVSPPDDAAAAAAASRHGELLKPPGALGALEELGVRLAGMAGECPPPLPDPAAVVVFAGDHGVHAERVSPWPQDVTAAMVGAFVSGGAAVCVLAAQAGASLTVVDVGVAGDLPSRPGAGESGGGGGALVDANVARGTRNLAVEAAMTVEQARAALDVGAHLARVQVEAGAGCLVGGEMGIANTTPSAALLAALLGRDPAEMTGRGTGIDDETLARKVGVVRRGVERARAELGPDPGALDVLASLGGLEIAALAGFMVGGAAARVPVIVDGFIAGAAAVAAERLVPGARDWMIAGHRSAEPGAAAALDALDLAPVLDLGLRLGEGTGAVLALHQVRAAALVLRDMGTLGDLGLGG